ncbi:spermidine synthase [Chloroflexota bacterium]
MTHSTRQIPRWLLYLAAFTAGMTVLGIEMSTTRLIGVVLGTSDVVWAAVITLVLVYLTVGYTLGGRWADRSPYGTTFFKLLAWAAFAAGMTPILARPLLLMMASAFSLADLEVTLMILVGLTVAILFAVPITLLGCVSPFVMRLAIGEVAQAGVVAGRVYALSTLGSILGTFAPVLVLIPVWGTTLTFAFFAGLLLGVALLGLYLMDARQVRRYGWLAVVLVVALVWGVQGPLKPAPTGTTLLYEAETPYNYVQVVEVNDEGGVSRQAPGTRFLLLNEGQGVHSVYHPDQLQTLATWDMFLAAPYFNAPPVAPEQINRVAIIGLAAGTIAQQYDAVYETIHIDGIEIDPGIVAAGRQYFAMNMPSLNVIVQDGRYGLNQLAGDYDLVAIDAYRVPYIPWHLTTVEFFSEVRDKLAVDGVVMINVGRAATDRRFVDAIAATMLEVFPAVHAIDVPYSFNTMLVGTQTVTDPADLMQNLALLPADTHPLLRDTLALAYQSLVGVTPSDVIFTDDRAPVETMINAMILDFILEGDNLAQLGG